MKVSLKWIGEYVDLVLSPKELAEKLTLAGLEVTNIDTIGSAWENIVIGRIANIEAHPNADRLKLVTVDLGSQQPTVICGASNLIIGDRVAFAQCGANLIDNHTGQIVPLKPAKIRGVNSEGMVCSEKELGISDNHEEIMVLPPEAPLGVPITDFLGDIILDLDITPNRPDCLSIIGIAREIAALSDQVIHIPVVEYEEGESNIDSLITVEIADPALCPRYCASLITDIKLAPSPWWMQQRLLACGVRSINNIVDVTNYVMLEYGQPLHAFDYQQIRRKQIEIRRARDGESIVSLDEIDRSLTDEVLVIADGEKAVAIAGIMGGQKTEVIPDTTSILLESANFYQATIRKGCSLLRLRTEASLRFEKGLSPDLSLPALKRATQLILEVAGGRAARGIADVYPGKRERTPIPLTTTEVRRLLGIELNINQISRALSSLGFNCQAPGSAEQLEITAPYWRSDVHFSADLIEEVARITGYDNIPTTLLSTELPSQKPESRLGFREKSKDIMVSCGFQEVLTYSLVSLDALCKLNPDHRLDGPFPLSVANPMVTDQEYLRTTLQASLLTTLFNHQKYQENGIRLFEIAKVYLPQERDLPQEQETLCAVLCGSRSNLSWHKASGEIDFFDAKGVLEVLISQLGVTASFRECNHTSLRPGRRAEMVIDSEPVGVIGELNPQVAESFGLSDNVCLFEINLEGLLLRAGEPYKYQPLSRFPTTIRDIALEVDIPVTYQQLKNTIASFPLVSQVVLFDLYHGKQVPTGKKSLAFRVVYHALNHTLTEEEVNKAQQQIMDSLYKEFGASLRYQANL